VPVGRPAIAAPDEVHVEKRGRREGERKERRKRREVGAHVVY
jgi:hypothetical protein